MRLVDFLVVRTLLVCMVKNKTWQSNLILSVIIRKYWKHRKISSVFIRSKPLPMAIISTKKSSHMNGVFKIWGLEKKIIAKFGNSYFREPQNLGTRNSTDFKIWGQDLGRIFRPSSRLLFYSIILIALCLHNFFNN